MKMKIAVLGTWHVHTKDYIKTVLQHPHAELVTIWDTDETRAAPYVEQAGNCKFTTDLNEILADPSIDGVVVCTATNEHPDVLIAAAHAGKHIFTEKVLTVTNEDARRVKEAVENSGKNFVISFPYLAYPEIQFIQKLIADGKLGELTYCRVRNCHEGALANWLPPHFYDKEQCGGGAMMDLGAHPMYLLNTFMGRLPEKTVSNFTSFTEKPVEDNACCTMAYENGAIGVAETAFVVPCNGKNTIKIELHGTKGSLFYNDVIRYCSKENVPSNQWVEVAAGLPKAQPSPLHRWIDCTSAGEPTPEIFGIDAAVDLTAMMDAAYRAEETQAWAVCKNAK